MRTIILGQRHDNIDLVPIRSAAKVFIWASSITFRLVTTRKRSRSLPASTLKAAADRIIRFAFDYAVRNGRKKVTVVHKANILKALTLAVPGDGPRGGESLAAIAALPHGVRPIVPSIATTSLLSALFVYLRPGTS